MTTNALSSNFTSLYTAARRSRVSQGSLQPHIRASLFSRIVLVRNGGQIGTNRRKRVEEFAEEIDAGQALEAVAWATRQRELEGSLRLFTARGVAKRRNTPKGALPRCRPWGRKGLGKCFRNTPAILVPSGTKLSKATGLRESCTLGQMV